MDVKIIELNINSIIGRARRHELELFLGEHKPDIVLHVKLG